MAESRPDAIGAHLEDTGTIKPLVTYLFGLGLSFLVGLLMGTVMASVWTWIGAGWGLRYIPFFLAGITSAFWFYGQGMGCSVPVGFFGVLTLFGRRTPFILSEGTHWLFPEMMSYIPVNHKSQVSDEVKVSGLSADNIRMTGRFSYRYQITRPLVYLGAENERASLDKIGESCFRDAFATSESIVLIRDEAQSHIAVRIDEALRRVASERYGIDILNVIVPEIKMPADYEAALERKRLEEAKREAEKVDIAAFTDRVDELKAKGISPELAVETLQVQRGLVKAERRIIRIEGAQGIADAVANTAKSIVETLVKGDN